MVWIIFAHTVYMVLELCVMNNNKERSKIMTMNKLDISYKQIRRTIHKMANAGKFIKPQQCCRHLLIV